jgi:hypothetical protein
MNKIDVVEQALKRRHLVMGGLAAAALAACKAPKIDGGAAAWNEATLRDADVVPANTDPSRRTRVVVIPSEDSASARGAGLAAVASSALETMLGSGGVEVIDRKLAGKLEDELKVAELKGSGSYGGPDVADYAIRVVMGNAGWNSTYVNASQYKNPLTGKIDTIPASYTHTATSQMSLKIFQLPSLKLVDQMDASGKVNNTGQQRAAGPGDALGLMRTATDSGIKGKRNEVLNEFAPKGYITDKRTKDKKAIFRVQLGKNTGAKQGDKVEIWTVQKVGNSFDEVSLGTGVMSDLVGNEGSWILVEDEKLASRVRKYDYVKVKMGGGFFDSLNNLLK